MIDRSWLRRPLTSEPSFGQSVPSLWKESEVTFERPAPIAKTHGGFSAVGAPVEYLTCRAHVQLDAQANPPMAIDGAYITKQMIRVFITWPVPGDPEVMSWDGSSLPQRDDTLIWTDALGREHRVHVKNVYSPLNLKSFMQIDSELFE